MRRARRERADGRGPTKICVEKKKSVVRASGGVWTRGQPPPRNLCNSGGGGGGIIGSYIIII